MYMTSVVHNIMKLKPKTILIDSSNLLHRAVWIGENVRTNVNPAYIFLTSIKKYVEKFSCSNVYSVWDKKLIYPSTNFRRSSKVVEYKGTRDKKKNEAVFKHEDLTTRLLTSLGVKNMYPGVLEADDVISWMSKKSDELKVIVSVDQDMLQLIDDNNVVYSPMKDVLIDKLNFEYHTGCPIDQFLRYKSMIGDKSDNLPGINKCGAKTARKYVDRYPTDDLLRENVDADALEPYFTNLRMIDLNQGPKEHPEDVELYEKQYDELQDLECDMDEFRDLCTEYNINTALDNINVWQTAFAPQAVTNTLADIVNSLGLNK